MAAVPRTNIPIGVNCIDLHGDRHCDLPVALLLDQFLVGHDLQAGQLTSDHLRRLDIRDSELQRVLVRFVMPTTKTGRAPEANSRCAGRIITIEILLARHKGGLPIARHRLLLSFRLKPDPFVVAQPAHRIAIAPMAMARMTRPLKAPFLLGCDCSATRLTRCP
jgi:hypothetical protein